MDSGYGLGGSLVNALKVLLKVPKSQKLKLFLIRGHYFESDQLWILISFILGFNGDNWDFLGSKCIPKHSITNLIIKNFASSTTVRAPL